MATVVWCIAWCAVWALGLLWINRLLSRVPGVTPEDQRSHLKHDLEQAGKVNQ